MDADWARDTTDRKTSSGYLFQLEGSSISRSSRKQIPIALSSTEAEYISAAYTSQEAVWLRQLLVDLGEPTTCAIVLYEVNQECVNLAASEK